MRRRASRRRRAGWRTRGSAALLRRKLFFFIDVFVGFKRSCLTSSNCEFAQLTCLYSRPILLLQPQEKPCSGRRAW